MKWNFNSEIQRNCNKYKHFIANKNEIGANLIYSVWVVEDVLSATLKLPGSKYILLTS